MSQNLITESILELMMNWSFSIKLIVVMVVLCEFIVNNLFPLKSYIFIFVSVLPVIILVSDLFTAMQVTSPFCSFSFAIIKFEFRFKISAVPSNFAYSKYWPSLLIINLLVSVLKIVDNLFLLYKFQILIVLSANDAYKILFECLILNIKQYLNCFC